MTATYDTSLPEDKDWVRFLCGDKGKASSVGKVITQNTLADEEIAALLIEEQNKYYAAARACGFIIAKGHGAVSKTVGNLSLSFGDSPESAYRSLQDELRKRGAELLLADRNKRIWNNL